MKPEWARHFQIDDTTWETLCSQAARQKSTPLDVALDMGLLNETKLLDWDRQRSGMATLRAEFFNAEPPAELFQAHDLAQCKTYACMPIGHWEGHTYWAKLASDQTQPANAVGVWILAPWSGMKKWFTQWESVSSMELTAKDDIPMSPMPITINTPESISLPEIPKAAEPMIDISKPLELSIPAPPAAIAVPPPVAAPVAAAPAVNTEALASIDFSSLMPPPAAHAVSDALTPFPTLEINVPVPDVAQTNPSITATIVETNPSIMAPPPVPKAPDIPADQINSRIRSAASMEDLMSMILGGWKNYFDKSMVLLFQDNQLILWRWHGSWAGTVAAGDVIPLNTPSIFKIVADSCQPYHGYVSAGEVNDFFFKKTNNGQYPDHVSIVPVIVEKKVAAMIFGACSVEAGKSISLPKLEEHASYASVMFLSLLPHRKSA
jgi:hypothetical protein